MVRIIDKGREVDQSQRQQRGGAQQQVDGDDRPPGGDAGQVEFAPARGAVVGCQPNLQCYDCRDARNSAAIVKFPVKSGESGK